MTVVRRSSAARVPARTARKVLTVARVLLADDNPKSRLTLQTVLEAGGYRVDSAASAAEAVGLMDQKEYELVLTDMSMESPEAGYKVIAHAQMKAYRPATAVVTSWHPDSESVDADSVLVAPQNLPELLGQVASLISRRASQIMRRQQRQDTPHHPG
jgi:CheY-like chemotaxis protein